jgi:hypothetical protein
MSSQDGTPTGPDLTQDGVSRRGLLRGAAGLGAAGLAAGLVAGSAAAANAAPAAPRNQDPATHQPATPTPADRQVVAHVRDADTGAIDLYVGTRHVQLTDPQLAARLTNAAG